MRFIENGKLVEKEQDEKSKQCKHSIKIEMIGECKYRYCSGCGMLAHEDGSFAHFCGADWCRCSN